MLFDPEAIENKRRFLDLALAKRDLVERVVARHMSGRFELATIPRVWEPGGGATLFRIKSSAGTCLLKVKHHDVWVESRLESESCYQRKPSLANEHDFLTRLDALGLCWVPKVIFWDEADSLQFLALEWLSPFSESAKNMAIDALLGSWRQLGAITRELFNLGIVHTDIHEHNLCHRDGTVVLIDFEEARLLQQALPYEQSLDVVGVNCYGNVGEFPGGGGAEDGLTCLARMRHVYQNLVRKRLPSLFD